MTKINKPKPLRIRDDETVVEVYCGKFVGTVFDGAAITITLGSLRYVPEKTDTPPSPGEHPSIYVTTRVSLSPNAVIELVNALSKLLNTMGVQQMTVADVDPKIMN